MDLLFLLTLSIASVSAQSYGNVISGIGTLTKSGAGTLVLSGTNTYTGATAITAGTLEIQGSIAASSSITNDGTLLFNSGSAQAYSNGISGSGALNKAGGGIFSGMYSPYDASFTALAVIRNLAPSGGGMFLEGTADQTVARSNFLSNHASADGGGIQLSAGRLESGGRYAR